MDSDKFTDEEINRVCVMMRIIQTFDMDPDSINKLPAMKNESNRFRSLVNRFMRELTDEQRDIVLEAYKKLCKQIDSE
jgi:hypothetical protein